MVYVAGKRLLPSEVGSQGEVEKMRCKVAAVEFQPKPDPSLTV
jgi:hypothetical protein